MMKPTTGTGLCSCFTVRLNDACAYYKQNGVWPDDIDSGGQFTIYKDTPQTNVSDFLFGKYENRDLPYIPFDCGWQYGWADVIRLDELSLLSQMICPVSNIIRDKSYDMLKRLGDRTAILYRGNDKCKEVPTASYEVFIQMARQTESQSFLVQTDEVQFFEAFKKEFPDTIRFEEIPQINCNRESYVMPAKGERVSFAINFISALYTIAKADKLIVPTGNTGLWAVLFRGHYNNLWQYNGNENKWRKL